MLPAYAGMILDLSETNDNTAGAPRIRGDDPINFNGAVERGTCSPHTRG